MTYPVHNHPNRKGVTVPLDKRGESEKQAAVDDGDVIVADPKAPEEKHTSSHRQHTASEAPLILVVEDDDDVRKFAARVLRDKGYRVIEAANGGVALVLLQQGLPIELLFTDVVMPGEPDGLALAERAMKLHPDLRVLYATGFAGAHRFGRHAVHGKVLSKPYRPRQLTSEIEQLIFG
jgi:CheY-like chemotaxis protein